MLHIIVPGGEVYDEINNIFLHPEDQQLVLEHSLISLSKWEQRWCKPYLTTKNKTTEEVIDYIKCMTITQNVPDEVYERLTPKNIQDINAYIEAPMTATRFKDDGDKDKKTIKGDIVTSELIYYWMITLGIPFECKKWHLNTLTALIKVCIKKNEPPKKMSWQERKALNAARKKEFNTRG